jgi:hypothetical protein
MYAELVEVRITNYGILEVFKGLVSRIIYYFLFEFSLVLYDI